MHSKLTLLATPVNIKVSLVDLPKNEVFEAISKAEISCVD